MNKNNLSILKHSHIAFEEGDAYIRIGLVVVFQLSDVLSNSYLDS